MPKMGDMFPSKWLASADIEEDTVLTISTIKAELVGPEKDEKWVLYFDEVRKGLVLNKTNTTTIAGLYGDDTDEWEGKKVTLYSTEVTFQGQTMLAIRVRLKKPKSATKVGAAVGASAGAVPKGTKPIESKLSDPAPGADDEEDDGDESPF